MAIQNKDGMNELITGFNQLSINEKLPAEKGSLWPFAINALYFGSPYLDQVQRVALDNLFGGSVALHSAVSSTGLAEVLPSGDTIMLVFNAIVAGRYCWKQLRGTSQSQELVQTINRGKLPLKPLFGDNKELAISFVNMNREQLEVVNFDGYVLEDYEVRSLFIGKKESDFQQLNTLCITESPEVEGAYLRIKELPKLQNLSLQGCTACKIELNDVTRFNYLNINGCEKFELKLSSIGLKKAQTATTFCIDQHLTCVDLRGVEGLTCALLHQVIQESPNIKQLKLAKHQELDGEIDLKLLEGLEKVKVKQCDKLTFAWNVAAKQRVELDVDETVSFVPTIDAVCKEESLLQACNTDETPPKLEASYNQLEDAIYFVTSNKCNRVNLQGFKITDEDLQTLVHGNPDITYLGISDSQLETGAALKEFKSLETLSMTDCQFSTPDLGDLSEIKNIDLSGSEIPQSLCALGVTQPDQAVEFAKTSQLQYLDFTGIKKLGIEHLQSIIVDSSAISTLILRKHSGLDGEIDLRSLQNLKKVEAIKCKGLVFIWDVAVKQRIDLDVDKTVVCSPSCEDLNEIEELVETLNEKFDQTLKNSFSQFDEAKKFIITNAAGLTHVNLEGFEVSDADLEEITNGNPNITHLLVKNSPDLITGEALSRLKNLQGLGIRGCKFFIGSTLNISHFKNLKTLALGQCPWANPELGDLTQLEGVHLGENSSLKPSLVSLGFNNMTTAIDFAIQSELQYLDFTGIPDGTGALFDSLFAQFDGIKSLIIHGQENIVIFKELSRLRVLEQLDIIDCPQFNMKLNLDEFALKQLNICGSINFDSKITCHRQVYESIQLFNILGTRAKLQINDE